MLLCRGEVPLKMKFTGEPLLQSLGESAVSDVSDTEDFLREVNHRTILHY